MNCAFSSFPATVARIIRIYECVCGLWTKMIFSEMFLSIISMELKSTVSLTLHDSIHQIKIRVHFHWENTEQNQKLNVMRTIICVIKGNFRNKIIMRNAYMLNQIFGQRFGSSGSTNTATIGERATGKCSRMANNAIFLRRLSVVNYLVHVFGHRMRPQSDTRSVLVNHCYAFAEIVYLFIRILGMFVRIVELIAFAFDYTWHLHMTGYCLFDSIAFIFNSKSFREIRVYASCVMSFLFPLFPAPQTWVRVSVRHRYRRLEINCSLQYTRIPITWCQERFINYSIALAVSSTLVDSPKERIHKFQLISLHLQFTNLFFSIFLHWTRLQSLSSIWLWIRWCRFRLSS